MSRPGARMFFSARKTMPLPYDYEVEYVEGRTGYGAKTVRIPLSSSVYSRFLDKSRTTIDIAAEAIASRYYNGSGNIFSAGYCRVGGAMLSCAGGTSDNRIRIIGSSTYGAHSCSSLDDFHSYRYSFDGNGHVVGCIDGVEVGSGNASGSTIFGVEDDWCYMSVISTRLYADSQQNTMRTGKMKITSGNEVLVDAIPVVVGGRVGWYDKISGQVSAVSEDCIFAGPAVYNARSST